MSDSCRRRDYGSVCAADGAATLVMFFFFFLSRWQQEATAAIAKLQACFSLSLWVLI